MIGLPIDRVNLVENWLTERFFYVNVNGEVSTMLWGVVAKSIRHLLTAKSDLGSQPSGGNNL